MNPNEAPNRMRTSDKEREQIAEILRAAMTEGRLTLEEGEERLAAVYATKYRDELRPLVADLPDAGRRAMTEAQAPEARVATRRALRRHASFVLLAAGLLTGLWMLSGAHFFWPAIPLVFLVMGLVRHARWSHYEPRYSYAHRVAPWNGPNWR
ncbi:DUF1707 SHOCT-like domain-containing protein [Paractinoplanes durhamensis]|uniref:DUF1707 domain-containing protein n=1 Tax=Paractinoplanes durhamensis TaxID=113563 RepID=A0ABQ3Z031_9ACTN|nr:DUF1707 domain-containing protein [Actinoplanes durhamensis]GIE03195.1 hypothetical protein Adu01nite_45450 [Actinoplanes durhamensis]